jgi:hypothetical protein
VRALAQRRSMHCASCRHEVVLAIGERIGFRDECPRCSADLHCCRQCQHHDPGAYNECRELGAERVADRERANRCEWFAPRVLPSGADDTRTASRSALDALFRPKSGG